ncbi:MAG TPA: SDR family oxidoreductase [Anaerolineales bacterium]|nr:SDR family oxidoreductase [Anaerolineales bacterium]
MRLKNKTSIITGGGRGIGLAIARAFAAEGAVVLLAARTLAEIEAAAAEINAAGGKALAVACDAADEAQVKTLVAAALKHLGRIDTLVNNAGAGAFRPAYGTPNSTWDKMMDVNARTTFLCTKHVWRPMREIGGGSIINISSTSGTRAYPMYAAYSASKWAQIGFTKATAEEGKPDNIRVNAIAPGKVDTAMREAIAEDKGRMLAAEDCAGAAVFFASDDSRFITGQVLEIEWFGG